MAAEWVAVWVGIATLGGTLIGVIWRTAKTILALEIRATALENSAKEENEVVWRRIDEHRKDIDNHADRIMKVETRLDYGGANGGNGK